LIERSR